MLWKQQIHEVLKETCTFIKQRYILCCTDTTTTVQLHQCTVQLPPMHSSVTINAQFSYHQCTVQLPSMHSSVTTNAQFSYHQCTVQSPPMYSSVTTNAQFSYHQCTVQSPPMHSSVTTNAQFSYHQCTVQSPPMHSSVPPMHSSVTTNAQFSYHQMHSSVTTNAQFSYHQCTVQLPPMHQFTINISVTDWNKIFNRAWQNSKYKHKFFFSQQNKKQFTNNCNKTYHIQPNKRILCLKKNWAMEKCQGICFYKRTPKYVSLDNKVFNISGVNL